MRCPTAFAALILGSCDQERYAPDACLWYVACLEQGDSRYAEEAAAKYGADGSCWTSGAEERRECADTCRSRLPASCAVYPSGPDTSDPPPDTTDTAIDEEVEPDPSIDVTWDSGGVTFALQGMDTTGFDLGMAETIDPTSGWFGEDCLYGTASYQECHVFDGTRTGRLVSIYDELVSGSMSVDDVRSGETTLFDDSHGDGGRLTYALTIDPGDCFVWGQDPSYYLDSSSFRGCIRLN